MKTIQRAKQASKRSELVATSVDVAGSLRSQLSLLASLDEDEHTRDESCEMAADIMATPTNELTHSILLTRSFWFWFIKNAPRFASLGAGQNSPR